MVADGLKESEINRICLILSRYYPNSRLHNKTNPLLEAIFILLTSQTDENKYLSTWTRFRKRFPRIAEAEKASVQSIYEAIQGGGLGKWKAQRIYNLLKQVKKKYGNLSLGKLETLGDEELEKELIKLDGIGIKSARCIMIYSYKREVFPIDTHVLRTIMRIGFRMPVESQKSKTFANKVQAQVPSKYRMKLHINLVQHGRSICKKNANCGLCPIIMYCMTGKKKILIKKVVKMRQGKLGLRQPSR